MSLGQKFLVAALGVDGAYALQKAVDRHPELAGVLVPRVILGWVDFTTEYEYQGEIPGIENSYIEFHKSEAGISGTIGFQDGIYEFQNASVYHLAASISTALDVIPEDLDTNFRDTVLVRLGKSIDTLAKAQAVMGARKPAKAMKLTQHGGYHVEHNGTPERPYSVVHSRTGATVQHGISNLKDAGVIANWHHKKYGGLFIPSLSKKVLDPSLGYKFSHEHSDLGNGANMTKVNVHGPDGQHIGAATFMHQGPSIVPGTVVVDEDHQRKGIASAMYSHAEKHTGKKIVPSTNQTPEGAALWSGNRTHQQFGKIELPGKTNLPTEPKGPQLPEAPKKQPKQQLAKLPSMSVGKSEALLPCAVCGGKQFKENRFSGCICYRDLAKSISTIAYSDGYVLNFGADVDIEAVQALIQTFKVKE